MSEFKASGFRDEFGSGGPDLVGITTMTSPYYFVPPSGSTVERPSSPPPGMLRFNTDIGRLEVWRNDHWATIVGESPNLSIATAGTGESPSGTGTRGLWGGGLNPSLSNEIDFVTIDTFGNAQDFGNLTSAKQRPGSCASRVRGYWLGGLDPGHTTDMDTVTIASKGNASDYGNLSTSSSMGASCSNTTRGIHAQGSPNEAIDYFVLSSTGSGISFGSLTDPRNRLSAVSSSVRALFAGGYSPGNVNIIDYVQIPTTGNATDFGDLTESKHAVSAAGNSTRGIIAAGAGGALLNTIEFVTIATTGNAQDFGDLTDAREYTGSCSSPTRMLTAGGNDPSNSNIIDAITIPTTGNSVDFGNLSVARMGAAGCSNGHGGL